MLSFESKKTNFKKIEASPEPLKSKISLVIQGVVQTLLPCSVTTK